MHLVPKAVDARDAVVVAVTLQAFAAYAGLSHANRAKRALDAAAHPAGVGISARASSRVKAPDRRERGGVRSRMEREREGRAPLGSPVCALERAAERWKRTEPQHELAHENRLQLRHIAHPPRQSPDVPRSAAVAVFPSRHL